MYKKAIKKSKTRGFFNPHLPFANAYFVTGVMKRLFLKIVCLKRTINVSESVVLRTGDFLKNYSYSWLCN